ncbi:arylesterase [Catenovulum agarivorans]|uniref:arylesterase n=1 Tax=Catenovulum agarivorans TaxID=1172192 RepID=UPI0002D74AE8|nr:arylesterase [Catenovulum agarivorans]
MYNPVSAKWFRFILFITFSVPLLVHSAQSQVKILILGDSLSAGYGLELKDAWASQLDQATPNWQIINASISGDTTQGGLNRLPKLLQQYQPDYVFIELGGNDGLRGFQLPVIKQNLIKLVQLTQENGAKPILAEIKIPPNYGQRYLTSFIAQYQQIAEQFQIPLIPFFIEQVALNPDLMLKDGIHPNLDAQAIIAEHMKKQFSKVIEG